MTLPVVRIARIGPLAAQFLASQCSAHVAAVFPRSAYLEAHGAFLCLGDPSLGDGPINAVAGEREEAWLARLVVGRRVEVGHAGIRGSEWRIDCGAADHWRPPPWPHPASAEEMAAAVASVEAIAADGLPRDGPAPLVLSGGTEAQATIFDGIAAPRIDRLRMWVAAGASPPPVDLLGLGPGLTPSGDDMLCGVLLALDALSDLRRSVRADRNALAAAIARAAPTATTPLSGQFLAAAAQGYGSAALHDFIAALIAADRTALPRTMAALTRIGHTSGWDALAGAVLAVSAVTQAARSTRSP